MAMAAARVPAQPSRNSALKADIPAQKSAPRELPFLQRGMHRWMPMIVVIRASLCLTTPLLPKQCSKDRHGVLD